MEKFGLNTIILRSAYLKKLAQKGDIHEISQV